jgi:hypothetical protein
LLIGIEEGRAEALSIALREAGYVDAVNIGVVVASAGGEIYVD